MNEPTWAEVADKTVDHIANGVQQIASTVEKLAPGAWEIAVRKQRIEGAVDLAIGVAILLVIALAFALIWKASKPWSGDDRIAVRTGISIGGAVFSIAFIFWLVKPGLIQSLNPEYFAAFEIAALVKK